MKVVNFLDSIRSQGRYSFTITDLKEALALSMPATLNSLSRLQKKNLIVSPAKGFYLILPPEYRAYGCLPADLFIPDLMKHLNMSYYVGYLSAAQFYGAAHQKPQRFQVVTEKNKPPIHCGRIYIEFFANKNVAIMPTKQFNTYSGSVRVATPEVLAADLVSSPKHAAGINNVATILSELAEKLDFQRIKDLMKYNSELFWVQRLGYMLESLGFLKLAREVENELSNKTLHWVRLVSNAPYKPLSNNKKWKIIVNVDVETDE